MRWLDSGQSAMMAALDHGPAHLPAELFAGSPERVLAGMKVHANTISHARLVALEETFPRTREHIGHDRFNEHSRLFLLQPGVTAQPLTQIGAGFEQFLIDEGEAAGAADLARFEWLWLTAYHAAEAEPLALDVLTSLAPDELLEHTIVRHPAAIVSRFDPLVHQVIGAEVAGLGAAEAIVIARPQAQVLVSPASALMAQLLAEAKNPVTIGNLLMQTGESMDNNEAAVAAIMQALAALINAGAIARL